MPTADEIEAARTTKGGWTKAQLAQWGVPWPPPKGWKAALKSAARRKPHNGETIEEQRKVEGFGDPQYTCSETELAIRVAIYTFLQQRKAAGELVDLTMSQDWSGNTLHLKGSIRPMDLARAVADAVVNLRPPT